MGFFKNSRRDRLLYPQRVLLEKRGSNCPFCPPPPPPPRLRHWLGCSTPPQLAHSRSPKMPCIRLVIIMNRCTDDVYDPAYAITRDNRARGGCACMCTRPSFARCVPSAFCQSRSPRFSMSGQDEDEVHEWLRRHYNPTTNDGRMVKRMRFAVYVKSKFSTQQGIWIPGCAGASLTHPWIGPRPLVGHAAVCASTSYTLWFCSPK